MIDENFIRQHDTGENPFRTPDGYFDDFIARLHSRMVSEGLLTDAPTTETKAKVVKMNPFKRMVRYAAAAVVAGICVGVGTYLYTHRNMPDQMVTGDSYELAISDETLDDALDYEMEYGMVDNNQIAYYLTEAY